MAAASFAAVLATLTANSRPIINTLTLIATDARAVPADAHAIVDALCDHIERVRPRVRHAPVGAPADAAPVGSIRVAVGRCRPRRRPNCLRCTRLTRSPRTSGSPT